MYSLSQFLHISSYILDMRMQNSDYEVFKLFRLLNLALTLNRFASHTQKFLTSFGFDGLDLDWEFPAWPALLRNRQEKRWFTRLVQHLHQEFKVSIRILAFLEYSISPPP